MTLFLVSISTLTHLCKVKLSLVLLMYLSMVRKDYLIMIFNGHMFQNHQHNLRRHSNGSLTLLALQLLASLLLRKLPLLQVIIYKLERYQTQVPHGFNQMAVHTTLCLKMFKNLPISLITLSLIMSNAKQTTVPTSLLSKLL